MSSWQRPYSEIRASDAERERVVDFLRDHALVGRLSHDELEDRIGLAYGALTVGDLERLIGDLPRNAQPVPRPPRASAAPQRRREPNVALIVAGLVLLGLPMVVATGVAFALFAVFALSVVVGPFLVVALIIAMAARRGRRPPPPMRWGRVA